MASRSAAADDDDDDDRLRELHRQVRACQRQMSDLRLRLAVVAPPCDDHDASTRLHQCRLQTLDYNIDRQQRLLLQLQRRVLPLNSDLLDDMFQQQQRIAEVSRHVL